METKSKDTYLICSTFDTILFVQFCFGFSIQVLLLGSLKSCSCLHYYGYGLKMDESVN